VFVVGLGVRWIALQQCSSIAYMQRPLSDARVYADRAMEIAAGDWAGPASFVHAPLYAYLLAPAAWLWGSDGGYGWLMPARSAQIALGALACALMVPMALAWIGHFRAPAEGDAPGPARRTLLIAAAAAMGLALYPPAVFYDLLIQKTTVDLLLSVVLLWLMGRLMGWPARGVGRAGLIGWAGLGALIGLFTLNRQNALALAPLLVAMPCSLAFGAGARQPKALIVRAAPAVAVGLVALVATLSPWMVRNRVVLGDWVISTPNLGQNLMMGNRSDATGTYLPTVRGRGSAEHEQDVWARIAERAVQRPLSAQEVSDYFRDHALDWIKENPAEWARLTVRKAMMLLGAREAPDTEDLYHYRAYSRVLRLGDSVWHFGALLPLGALGVLLSLRAWPRLWPLYAWLAIIAATVVAFVVFGRYRFPMVPVLMLFAAYGVVRSIMALRHGNARTLVWPALGCAATAVITQVGGSHPRAPQVMSYVNHAAALADLGRLDEALTEAERAVSLDPTNADGYAMRGSIALDALRWPDAARDFQQACDLDPSFPGAWTGLGNARLAMGQLMPALHAYERSLAIWPDDATTLAQLGAALAQLGELDRAKQAIERALALDPHSITALTNLGALRMAMGDPLRAIEALRQACELDRTRIEPRLGLVVALHSSGQNAAAIESAREAWQAFPTNERAQQLYFEVLLRAQRFDEAAAALRAIRDADPAAAWALEAERQLRAALEQRR
jgi:tetratricopeptide (TPR) repeat protein